MAKLNINNRTIFCRDNLDILEGLNSESVDLMYLDPPFNKNKVFTAPMGSSAEGAGFDDYFREKDVKEEWIQTIEEDNPELFKFLNAVKAIGNPYNFCYLCYMAIRLIEMHRVLKDTGSLYLHCDSTMNHYLKLLLDIIFGEENFRREIVWSLQTSSGYKSQVNGWVRGHDIIIYYVKSNNFFFEKQYLTHNEEYKKRFNKFDDDGKRYRDDRSGKRKQYLEDTKGVMYTDVWDDIMSFQQNSVSKEITGYPTQKPLALIHRIIKASSKEGDMVLDPFCGCATTCVASEMLNRKWIGVDTSIKAYELVKDRLKKEVKKDLFEPEKEVIFKTNIPKRTDKGKDDRLKKWVYIISHPQYDGEYKVGIAKYVESRLNL